jgi:hypothetical protein
VARTRRGSDVLTAVAAASGTALCAWAVAPGIVGTLERAVFRSVNGWPDFLQWPLWSFQTLGVLGMPLVVAGGALLCRRWRLAAGLVLLVPAKLFVEHQVLKELVHRERPGTTIPDAVLRDVPSAGPSFPSGHAVARIYLGAHAPLDVVGGALAGVAVAALLNLLVGVSPGPAVPATPRAPAAPRGGRARRAVLRRRR